MFPKLIAASLAALFLASAAQAENFDVLMLNKGAEGAMVEAAQIASLGQNGQGIDGSDPRNRAQQLIIRPVAQQFDGAILDGIALADQASAFGQHQAE